MMEALKYNFKLWKDLWNDKIMLGFLLVIIGPCFFLVIAFINDWVATTPPFIAFVYGIYLIYKNRAKL